MAMLLLLAGLLPSTCTAVQPEYQIKAAFLYKFLFFAQWPSSAESAPEVVIGILGNDLFNNAFEPVEGTLVDGLPLRIRRFPTDTPADRLKSCRVLFICSSAHYRTREIIARLADAPVLTVSEVNGFAEAGGMLNFIRVKDNLRFEVNQAAAKRSGITLRSKLLRIAVRIIGNGYEIKD